MESKIEDVCALLYDLVIQVGRIADRLDGTIEVQDIDRAKVYSEHLGSKLKEVQP